MKQIGQERAPYMSYEYALEHIKVLFGDYKLEFDIECLDSICFSKEVTITAIISSVKIVQQNGIVLYWPILSKKIDISKELAKEFLNKFVKD